MSRRSAIIRRAAERRAWRDDPARPALTDGVARVGNAARLRAKGGTVPRPLDEIGDTDRLRFEKLIIRAADFVNRYGGEPIGFEEELRSAAAELAPPMRPIIPRSRTI